MQLFCKSELNMESMLINDHTEWIELVLYDDKL